ncbi:MAG: hypothetical protein WA434_12230 [Candidatus Acidiferrales bacterium]
MRNTPLRFTNVRTLLLVAAGVLCFSTPAHSQSTQNAQSTSAQNAYDRDAQSNRYAQDNDRARDNDGPSRGVVQFDRFMDSHPDIATQVRQKPWLLTNYNFLQSHPDLNAFLKARPQLNAEISQNSTAFMQLENRLDQPDGRRDLAELDRFMDSHPSISAQLKQKPWLVTNYEFLQSHPDLNTFLQDHPQLRTEVGQNPVAFMQEENSFDQPNGTGANGTRDRDAAEFNRWLDTHREVGEQVRKKPDLVNDRTFVKNHEDLQRFLQQNPAIRDELRRDPNTFGPEQQQVNNREYASNRDTDVTRDNNVARHQDADARDRDTATPNRDNDRDNGRGYGRDNDRRDVVQFDRFLDSHREIAEQLRKNPSLADNQQFVQNHPALQDYLRDNPGVRDQIAQNPNTFMQQEDRLDAGQHWNDRDATHQHMASFGEFLGGHSDIAHDVSKNPSVVKNQDYMRKHPELNSYLSAHPEVRDDMMADPDNFVKGAQQFKSGGSAGVGVSTSGSGSGTSTGASTGTGVSTGTSTPNPKPRQ